MLTSNQVRQVFNGKIVKECKRIPAKVQKDELENRKDLRGLLTVTIDGDDAKDFDDAISIVKNEKGYVLYVHIADVSHYVKKIVPLIKKPIYEEILYMFVIELCLCFHLI